MLTRRPGAWCGPSPADELFIGSSGRHRCWSGWPAGSRIGSWPASCLTTTRTRPVCRPRPPRPRRHDHDSPCSFRRGRYFAGRMYRRLIAVFAWTAATSGACGQSDPTAGKAAVGDLPPAIVKTLEALGASSGVPDGLGASWEPSRPVSGQAASMSLFNAQAGLTLPVWTSADQGVFATGSARGLFSRGGAVFPDTRTPFPDSLWDLQAGGAYVRQVADGQIVGV